MKNKVLLATALVVLTATYCFPQAQVRLSLKLDRQKNEPVNIEAVKLDEQRILPDELFTATDGWRERLVITVKNVSDRPISFVSARVASTGGTESNPGWIAIYAIGNPEGQTPPEQMIEPGATAHLVNVNGAPGDQFDPRPLIIQLERVIWENDPTIIWGRGKLMRQDKPGSWKAMPPPATDCQQAIAHGSCALPSIRRSATGM